MERDIKVDFFVKAYYTILEMDLKRTTPTPYLYYYALE